MQIILFDSSRREALLPLTYLKPVAALRIGILTIAEKWQRMLNLPVFYAPASYLQKKYSPNIADDNLFIDGGVIPDPSLVEKVLSLQNNEAIFYRKELVAVRLERNEATQFVQKLPAIEPNEYRQKLEIDCDETWTVLTKLSDIFTYNERILPRDFSLLTKGRRSQPIHSSNIVIGDRSKIFIEEGAVVEGAFLNSTHGVIYIGKDAEVMEGSMIRGSVAICDHAVVKQGCKLLKGSTIGPYCKVGGEVNNTVFQAYSNKAHEGYIGNAVVGEWCNIGAGSNFSNLQNNYHSIKQWHYPTCHFKDTELQFCGVIMGDHSKCGISSMFKSGTVIGVGCNLFGTGYHEQFIPSFSYGMKDGKYETYRLEKLMDTERMVAQRRDIKLSEIDEEILTYVFNHTNKNDKND